MGSTGTPLARETGLKCLRLAVERGRVISMISLVESCRVIGFGGGHGVLAPGSLESVAVGIAVAKSLICGWP